jgi:putrescine aminotransferase
VNELEQKILEIGAEKVAVFIAEPILASGGVIIPPEGYHKACHAICGKYDVVYISDEVVTAFGRLGHFFSSKAVFDVDADIITSAKGLTSGYIPMGLMMVSDRLLDDLKDAEHESGIFSNGFTYSGHPVSCVAALKNIEIMERENMMQHVQDITPYFQEQLQSFADIPIVVNVRGMGLMGCIECEIKDADKGDEGEHLAADYDIGNRIDKHCQELGLIVRPIINMCVFSPPLVITKPQIDEMFSILRKGLELTMQDLKDEGLLHR